MAVRRILNLLDFNELTEAQKKEIRRILQSQQKEIESELKLVERALAKKRKSKRTSKP